VHRYQSHLVFIPEDFSPFGERVFLTFCLCVSLILVARIWIFHRHDKLLKKIFWSALLMLPLLGWALYGAFYSPVGGDPPDRGA